MTRLKYLTVILGMPLLGAVLASSFSCTQHNGATLPAVPTLAIWTPTVQSTITCSHSTVTGNTVPGRFMMDQSGNVTTVSFNLNTGGIQAISVYLANAAGLVRGAIYTDSFDGPLRLVCQSDPQTAVNGWNPIYLPEAYVTAGTYWLAAQTQNATETAYDFTGDSLFLAYNWDPFPDPFPQGPLSDVMWTNVTPSMFVNYCVMSPQAFPTPTWTPSPSITPTATETPP